MESVLNSLKKVACVGLTTIAFMGGMKEARAKTLYVDDDGPADFNSIQAAIDDANDGDKVIVEKGTYSENINFKGKNITLTSKEPDDSSVVKSTTIDGGSFSWH